MVAAVVAAGLPVMEQRQQVVRWLTDPTGVDDASLALSTQCCY